MDIKGKSALVTGGASGLGEATVRRLHAEGAHVVIVDKRDEADVKPLVDELGERVTFVGTDVSDEAAVQQAVDTAKGIAPLTAVVSCAGVAWAQQTFHHKGGPHALEYFELVQKVNVVGTFNVARLSAQAMYENEPGEHGERGVIVNTASVAAFDGQIGQVAYAASKGAVAAMTLPIARDLSAYGIRVCTIAPGTFDTPMLAALPEETREKLAQQIPFPKRLGSPSEYADLAFHIISNDVLNGETIRLDGAIRMAPK